MRKKMKIMIAYDGSSSADTAIDDLRFAGLPNQGEALIATVTNVAETAIPETSDFDALRKLVTSKLLVKTITSMEKEAIRVRAEATELACAGSHRASSVLPGWQIGERISLGAPANELLTAADEWEPDLIVIGSHGRSAFGRFFLGSVSAQVAAEAKCSVRVVRCESDRSRETFPRILVGVDHSAQAERAMRAVAERNWTKGTQVRLVSIDDGFSPERVSAVLPDAERMFEWAENELRKIGLDVSIEIKKGKPKSALLEEAHRWNADSVFVAADWLSQSETEQKLSEAAGSLVTDAPCAVEVVR